MHAPADRSTSVLWACVEEGFHVGSRAGEFLGFVDQQAEQVFQAFNAHSEAIGSFPSLKAATSAVELATDGLKGAIQ